MADYKVPQDVEADDKLIGPFSFRQFVYLIIVALSIALAWGLSQLFVGLAIIPLPIIVFFGALALPLRKDQPMEIYMAAIVSFYIKPRLRRWDPEGVESLIEITAPKTVEVQRSKDISQSEAEQRLSYLANIVDSQGWAIRGIAGNNGTAMNTDIFLEAQEAEDILDTNTSIAQNFGNMMAESTERVREEARQRMMQAAMPEPAPVAQPVYDQQLAYQQSLQQVQQAYQQPAAAPMPQQYQQSTPAPILDTAPQQYYQQPTPQPASQVAPQPIAPAYSPAPQPQAPFTQHTPSGEPALEFNPYPNIRQSVIQPLGDSVEVHPAANIEAAEPTPATNPVSEAMPQEVEAVAPAPANPEPSQEVTTKVTPKQAAKEEKEPKLPPKAKLQLPTKQPATKKRQNKPSTSGTGASADIINLANNSDLSIRTIAHEAERLKKKASSDDGGEVVISLR